MHDPHRESRRQQAIAWEWVSRVLAICVVMVLPGIGGDWIDKRFGTTWWALAGFAFGFISGMSALLVLVQRGGDDKPRT